MIVVVTMAAGILPYASSFHDEGLSDLDRIIELLACFRLVLGH